VTRCEATTLLHNLQTIDVAWGSERELRWTKRQACLVTACHRTSECWSAVHSADEGHGEYVHGNIVITCQSDVCRPAATTTRCKMHGWLFTSYVHMGSSKDWTVYCTAFVVTSPATILDLLQPEVGPFDLPFPKTLPHHQIWSRLVDPFHRYHHLKFQITKKYPCCTRVVYARL